MKRRILSIAAAIAVAALAAGLYFGRANQEQTSAAALMGLALPDVDGREQRLDQWKGKVLIVNFWATWCVPCREEMPEFVKAQRELGDRSVQFVGIAADDAAPGLLGISSGHCLTPSSSIARDGSAGPIWDRSSRTN